MNLLRKAFVPLAGVAVIVLVISMAGPRAVHAVVSTLVSVVNTSANPVPIHVESTLDHDGQYFDVTMTGTATPPPDPTLTVPAGVVLTDAHVTFSIPENDPNSASLYITDGGGKTLVYQIVNSTTFAAGIDLGSGIPGPLSVVLSCYNIAGNHCQGAMMWSGYTP